MLIVLMKYPRFKVPIKPEDRSISAIRAYCHNPNCPDPQIKAICSNLPEEQNSKQGDHNGFFSAAAFCLHLFSASMLLNLSEEYGLFYMCLELTMHAAVEMPRTGAGGYILNWNYVGPTTFYCFLLINVRCYYHSLIKKKRDENGDNNNAGGGLVMQPSTMVGSGLHNENNQQGGGGRRDDGDQQPTQAVSILGGDGLRQPELELNQQGDGDDDAEGGGRGGGGRETGDQRHKTGFGSDGSNRENESAERAEGKSSVTIPQRDPTSGHSSLEMLTRRKSTVQVDEEKPLSIKVDYISDRKSADTGSKSPGKLS